MGLPKKALFFLVMLALTLGAIEGLARVAYWIIYGEAYEQGLSSPMAADAVPGDELPAHVKWIPHPYFGYTSSWFGSDLNAMPPAKRNDIIVIGLLGGSVARGVTPSFRKAVYRYFRENGIEREPVVRGLAFGGMKQPQQLMIVAYMLTLGGEFDIIVNLDGFNEIEAPHANNKKKLFPFFPALWDLMASVTTDQIALIGHIRVLRDKRDRMMSSEISNILCWSAAFGLVHRTLLERIDNEIRSLHHRLADMKSEHSLEKNGPEVRRYQIEEEIRQDAVRVWYRDSVLLAGLAKEAGATYYHFLQPNQYFPDSKPLSEEEREKFYISGSGREANFQKTYPLLIEFGNRLKEHDINYFNLTQMFKNNHETLYRDDCCHFNAAGMELVAREIARVVGSASPDAER